MNHEWLETETIIILHDEQLAEHGGSEGLRDRGLLESAVARARNLAAYEESPDIAVLAAAYAYGIARNHPFVDGNKRAAWLSAATFLELNGFQIEVGQAEVVVVMEDLAKGELTEQDFAAWLREQLATAS
ncbi:MAG TPA: type II toxin-antitoxin system death-on-curing family toxin [Alphaproteobacteria bacterium]|nr:type II toxin-antitoxin system death-on-curing family toxin [Alphaproteobacteria bacterium]